MMELQYSAGKALWDNLLQNPLSTLWRGVLIGLFVVALRVWLSVPQLMLI